MGWQLVILADRVAQVMNFMVGSGRERHHVVVEEGQAFLGRQVLVLRADVEPVRVVTDKDHGSGGVRCALEPFSGQAEDGGHALELLLLAVVGVMPLVDLE